MRPDVIDGTIKPKTEPGATRSPPRVVSIRSLLTRLTIACVLLASLPAAYLVARSYFQERKTIGVHTRETVRALTTAVDSELLRAKATLQALATSFNLQDGDLAGFHAQAVLALAPYPNAVIILSDQDGNELLNTDRAYGFALPRRAAAANSIKVFATGQPAISDVVTDALTGRKLVAVDVPVFRDGRVMYDLAIGLPVEHFAFILQRQQLPEGWVCAIADASAEVVWRTQTPERFVGAKMVPDLRERVMAAAEGNLYTTTLEGTPVYTAFSRSLQTGWIVALGIPSVDLRAQVWRDVSITAAGASALALAAFLIAQGISRRIARAVGALTNHALALGRGEPVDVAPLGLLEADEVGRSLTAASRLLLQRAEQRDGAEAALSRAVAEKQAVVEQKDMLLREMNHRIKNSLQSVSSVLRIQARSSTDPVVQDQLNSACQRVLTIAHVHEQFYRGAAAASRIEVARFLRDLCDSLQSTFSGDGSVGLEVFADEAEMTADDAIPIGLLVNELVTNAYKYAFDGRDGGTITVSYRLADGERRLDVIDDGRGLPAGFAPETSTGLGMKLVLALAGSLRGRLEASGTTAGSRFTVRMPADADAEEPIPEESVS